MTLVCEKFSQHLKELDVSLRRALLCPLYIDTGFWAKNLYQLKYYDEDIDLKDNLLQDIDEEYFKKIKNLKNDSYSVHSVPINVLL